MQEEGNGEEGLQSSLARTRAGGGGTYDAAIVFLIMGVGDF